MKNAVFILLAYIFLAMTLSACSNFQEFIQSKALFNKDSAISSNPLKSDEDKRIEKMIVGGKWLYQREPNDCAETYWAQHFYKNGYYKSGGASCLLSDSFSVNAEAWHVKGQILYILNLSPIAGEDIILKYGVELKGRNRMILRTSDETYTFIRKY
jgi:hypothetical protein